jgi:hypothetical protein
MKRLKRHKCKNIQKNNSDETKNKNDNELFSPRFDGNYCLLTWQRHGLDHLIWIVDSNIKQMAIRV